MKWNMIIGALVLSLGLCGHSFAGGLLDKVLGCGCDAPACGCEAAPACGCEAEPTCGCEPSCGCDLGCTGCNIGGGLLSALCNLKLPALPSLQGCGCDAEPACGCEAAPACGCEAEPTCGCEPSCGCDLGCTGCNIGGGLLSALCNLKLPALPSLNSCGCDSGCDCDSGCADSGSDGDDLEEAPEASDAAPMPPAPIVDPSAFVPSKKRHVILTSVIR